MLSFSFPSIDPQSLLFSLLSILRWVAVALVLLNYRAFPLVWHLRVFWTIILERVKMVYTLLADDLRRDYVKSVSPIGANPFELAVAYKTTVGFSDLDYNIHLSNSSYAKILDIARMRAVLTWFPSLLEAGTRLGLGASHFHFLKEIPAGTEYEIRLNIVGWEDKWMHVVAQYVTYPKQRKGLAPVRPPISRANTSADSNPAAFVLRARPLAAVPENDTSASSLLSPPLSPRGEKRALASEDSRASSVTASEASSRSPSDDEDTSTTNTPATSVSSSPSPQMSSKPLLTVDDLTQAMNSNAAASSAPSTSKIEAESAEPESWRINTLPELPAGAVLHCVHVSTYCFKHNRITVPPRVALIASGFGDPAVGRWDRVQEIRNTRQQERQLQQQGAAAAGRKASPPASAFSWIAPGTEAAAGKKRRIGGLREILLGGWRRYEEEGLWNLTEYEERRRLGVERFAPLRTGLLALQSS